jgi:hypothetical protein
MWTNYVLFWKLSSFLKNVNFIIGPVPFWAACHKNKLTWLILFRRISIPGKGFVHIAIQKTEIEMRLLKSPKTNGENNHFVLPLYFKFSPQWTNWKSMVESLIISVSCVVLCTRRIVLDLYKTLTTNFIIFTKMTNSNVANILNVFKMPQFHGILPILHQVLV